MNSTGTGDALYDNRGNLIIAPGNSAMTVMPLIYADGLKRDYLLFGGCGDTAPQNCADTEYANRFRDNVFQQGEEMPRIANHLMKVFGGISSQFFFIHQDFGNYYGKYKMGFKRKIIEGDPRATFLTPPGFPPTLRLKIDELYQKIHMGKSPLITI